MSEPVTVIAVDIGTSAVRAAIVDAEHGVRRLTRVERGSSVGGRVFDADALDRDVRRALIELDVDDVPRALAISAHIGSVAVDGAGRPVAMGGGWADVRGVERLAMLEPARLGELLRAAGRPAVTGGALALALELRASDEGTSVRAILSPKDAVVFNMSGVLSTDTVNAAYTLAGDVRSRTWQSGVLADLGVPDQWFPTQVAPDAVVGRVSADASVRYGVPEGVPIVSGGPDGSVGLGILLGDDETVIADVAGTTDVVGMLVRDPATAADSVVLNPAVVPDRWVVGGATGATGAAVALWRRMLGTVDEDLGEAAGTTSRGLHAYPSLSGERFPRWRPDASASLVGQTPEHGGAEILHAVKRGASFTVREGIDLLDPERRRPVLLAGGAARSPQLARLRAESLGRTVRVADQADVTLLGAAGLAMVGVGIVADMPEARERLRVRFHEVRPDDASIDAADAEYADWLAHRPN